MMRENFQVKKKKQIDEYILYFDIHIKRYIKYYTFYTKKVRKWNEIHYEIYKTQNLIKTSSPWWVSGVENVN